ncbi:MAG: O-methyltransferase [Lentimicrobium sp.]|jgi:predicted O-methyltransferase YrrM|nr:O-methyltransferase [Lentimicrobium sp.]
MNPLQEKQQYKTTDVRYEQYALEHTTPEDALLTSLVRETNLAFNTPSMLSGNLQGQFLKMLCHMFQPEKVIEVGTFTGYSAIVMAQALKPGAMLHTIDNNPEVEALTARYISEAGLSYCIIQHQGAAADIIPTLEGPFDLAFIDADKENYLLYYELILGKLRPGGFIIADNVLWYGKVFEPELSNDKETRGITAFNNFVKNDERVEQVMVPIRDGLMLIRKI